MRLKEKALARVVAPDATGRRIVHPALYAYQVAAAHVKVAH
jgi:hypothetical protein